MSRVASTLRILVSPFSTSLFAALYKYRPMNVNPIPAPWIGWTLWLNHKIAIHMTHTRLAKEAMEYVTGEVDDRITNAIMFCAKCARPLTVRWYERECIGGWP